MPVFLNERFDKSVPIFKFTNKTHFHVFISILVLLQQTPFSLWDSADEEQWTACPELDRTYSSIGEL